jgi:hypothetical protein
MTDFMTREAWSKYVGMPFSEAAQLIYKEAPGTRVLGNYYGSDHAQYGVQGVPPSTESRTVSFQLFDLTDQRILALENIE